MNKPPKHPLTRDYLNTAAERSINDSEFSKALFQEMDELRKEIAGLSQDMKDGFAEIKSRLIQTILEISATKNPR